MLKVLTLTALLAVSLAAPAPAPNSPGLTRPSPINPDVISDPKPKDRVVLSDVDVKHHHVNVTPVSPDGHRHKRNEDEKKAEKPQDAKDTKEQSDAEKPVTPTHGHDVVTYLADRRTTKSKVSKRDTKTERSEKPHSAIAKEGLQHNPQRKEPTLDRSKGIKAPVQLSQHKPENLPAKPHSVIAKEGLQHNPQRKEPTLDHTKDIKGPVHSKISKRDTKTERSEKPHSVIAKESPQRKEPTLDRSKGIKAPVQLSQHKPENLPAKPHSVIAKEGLQHSPQRKEPTLDHTKDVKSPAHSKVSKRDVQTERPEKPHSVVAREGLQHVSLQKELPTLDRTKDIKAPAPLAELKREDRPEQPHSVIAKEGLQNVPLKQELPSSDPTKEIKLPARPLDKLGKLPEDPVKKDEPKRDTSHDIIPLAHHLVQDDRELSHKNKRDTHEHEHEKVEKPVIAREDLTDKSTSAAKPNPELEKAVKTIEERLAQHKGEPAKKQKRDIPVPTVPKFQHPEKSEDKPEPALVKPLEETNKPLVEPHQLHEHEATSSTEHPVIRHKPVSVSELFARQNNDEEAAPAAPPAVPIPAPAEKA